MLEDVLAPIHAGSWMRILENTPSRYLGEYSENLLRVHRRFITIRYNVNWECLGKVER
jgi:hypothetical protein